MQPETAHHCSGATGGGVLGCFQPHRNRLRYCLSCNIVEREQIAGQVIRNRYGGRNECRIIAIGDCYDRIDRDWGITSMYETLLALAKNRRFGFAMVSAVALAFMS